MPESPERAIDPQAIAVAQRAMLPSAAEHQARMVLLGLCDPTRLKIIRALRDTPLAASDLAKVIGRSRSATSQHLRVLREVKAVAADRKGSVIRYRLADGTAALLLEEICGAFDRLA